MGDFISTQTCYFKENILTKEGLQYFITFGEIHKLDTLGFTVQGVPQKMILYFVVGSYI